MTLLSCDGISKSFVGVRALQEVSLDVEEGEVLGIIGPNGSGKTTLFNIIAGQERADKGTITLDGKKVTNAPSHRMAAMGVARTFQNLRLFAGLSVVENVMAGGHLRAPTHVGLQLFRPPGVARAEREGREEALELLQEVGLGAHHDRLPHQLSYGQTKRLEMARALNIRPKILLLDEPTAGMNDAQAAEILELVRRVKEKWRLTLVVIEHNVPVLVRFVDRLVALDAGRIAARGAPADVIKDRRVIEAYLGAGAAA
jgi:branched-chain amino acid transport system ATP-binding protein